MAPSMIGVDLGGTNIKAGIVEGNIITRTASADTTPDRDATLILDSIAEVVSRLESNFEVMGIAVPGAVGGDGICSRMPNIRALEGANIAAELSARLRCRVVVENDATTAAWAERHLGHGKKYASFLVVTLGTGIGGGLVIDGQLRRGRMGFAGEIGHTPVDRTESGWLCSCGLNGCVESYAGTRGIIRKFSEYGETAEEIRPIADAARSGSGPAKTAFEFMGHALGIGLAAVQNILDLDAIVFTGGISASFDLFAVPLRASLAKYVFAPSLAQLPLLTSDLGTSAGLLGAAYLSTL